MVITPIPPPGRNPATLLSVRSGQLGV